MLSGVKLVLNETILAHAQTLWDFNQLNHALTPADIILVMGSHDVRVAEHAAKLYNQGFAPQLICTGGIAHAGDIMDTGWHRPEADVFAEILIEHGVPETAILREPQALNTGDNFELSFALLQKMGRLPKTMISVTKPYMQRRAMATAPLFFKNTNLQISVQPTSMADYFTHSLKGAEIDIALMVGDVQRLKLYPPKDFMLPTDVPPHVWQAFDALVDAGFTANLLKN